MNQPPHLIRRNFLTGLVILLPFALTLWILLFLINFFTAPFVGLLEYLIEFNLENFSQTTRGLILFATKISILACLILFIVTIGYLGQHFFVRSLFRYGDLVLQRIPFVCKIYTSVQEVVKTFFQEMQGKESPNFSQVVLVPFPDKNSRSIGFVTGGNQKKTIDLAQEQLVSVFVPGTPNPIMGFLLLFPQESLIYPEMTTEEALKFIVSCGVMAGPLKKVHVHPMSST